MSAIGPQLDSADSAYLQGIIVQLSEQSADRVESDSIEIKGWCSDARELFEKVSEYAACLANADGGFLIIGVEEEGTKAARFRKCPHGVVDTDLIWRKVNDLTVPSVKCQIFDISTIVAGATGVPTAEAYALKIPKTETMNGHMTTKGVSKRRVGKECRANFTAEDDQTRLIVPGASTADISDKSVQWAMASHQRKFPKRAATWTTSEEFLLHAGLLVEKSPEGGNSVTLVPLAAILLFGTEAAIKRYVGHSETIITTPLGTTNLRQNIIESYKAICSTKASLASVPCPQVSLDSLKELVVNAYVHRCYRTASSVIIESNPDLLSIQSPGGLAAGLNITNILHCVPVYRNLLLAEGARFSGLSDKFGQGINTIYQAVLEEGFDFPIFENEGGTFAVTIHTKGSSHFREFVRKRSSSLGRLDDIVALRVLLSNPVATLDELASAMQRGREQARRILAEMSSKAMIAVNYDSTYSLTDVVRNDIRTIFSSEQLTFPLDLGGGEILVD